MPVRVAIDTMTLVWGVRQEGTAEQKKRASWLFEMLDKSDSQIVIPTIVVAEYLTPVQPQYRDDVVAELNKRFFLAPFDIQCAALAASLFTEGQKTRKKGVAGGRAVLKADAMIVASAKIHQANIFYTGDAQCLKLAETVMSAADLPNQPSDLFGF